MEKWILGMQPKTCNPDYKVILAFTLSAIAIFISLLSLIDNADMFAILKFLIKIPE